MSELQNRVNVSQRPDGQHVLPAVSLGAILEDHRSTNSLDRQTDQAVGETSTLNISVIVLTVCVIRPNA